MTADTNGDALDEATPETVAAVPETPAPAAFELVLVREISNVQVEVRPSDAPDATPIALRLPATHRASTIRVEAGPTPDEPGPAKIHYSFATLPPDTPTATLRSTGDVDVNLLARLAGFVRFLRGSGHVTSLEWNATRAVPLVVAYLARHNILHATVDELDAAARKALALEKVDDDDARALLVTALSDERERLVEGLGQLPASMAEAAELVDGVPALDERFALYLEKVGAPANYVEKVRTRGRERAAEGKPFDLWIEGEVATAGERGEPPNALPTLARALWRARVRKRHEQHTAKRPALAVVVHEPVVDLLSQARRAVEANGQRVIPLPGSVLVEVAHLDETVVRKLVDRGIEGFRGITAHKAVRWLVFTGHGQALDGAADPRVIRVDGGVQALAHEHLGLRSKSAVDELRAFIEAAHAVEVPVMPGATSRLLTRTYVPAKGQRRTFLELVLGTALLPDYVHTLKRMGAAGRELRLVPVLELPPLVGRSNEHGAQASLSMLVVAHVRDHARELVETGGVTIARADWERLAARAGLPVRMVPAVLDRWTQDGDDAGSFLRRVERDRYVLTDAKAHAFLQEGGRGEIAGSEAGKASVRKRRQAQESALRRAGKGDGK